MKTSIVSLFLLTILNVGCASNPTSSDTPCTTNTSNSGVTSTFTGDQVPDMQKLIDEGKFEQVGTFGDLGTTWNGFFPTPIDMKIDDLKVIDFGTGQSYEQIMEKIAKLGYVAANSHEAVWFATANPDQQLQADYYFASSEVDSKGNSVWIKFGSAPHAAGRYVGMEYMLKDNLMHRDIQAVVHDRAIAK